MKRAFASVATISGLVLLGLATGPGVSGQTVPVTSAARLDVDALGPKVGERIPPFALKDQHGVEWTRESIMGPKGAMLVFFRSADWWPYCKTQLVELQGRLAALRGEGLGLAAISYDPVPILADFAARRGITFPLLSDPGSETIKRYGILNTTIDPKNALFGYPFPGTFIVDRRGLVTSRVFEEAYQERDTVSSLMVRLGQRIDAPATRIAGAHLTLVTYLSDQVAAQGTHFSIVADITPSAHVHVYAPGASTYIPVALTVRAPPGVIVRKPTFPKAEDYFFKPLNEHVPVYQHPFRIVQDVMLDPSREGSDALKDLKTLTLAGSFNYQACDDKVCFPPQSIPLSWTFALKPLDRERAK